MTVRITPSPRFIDLLKLHRQNLLACRACPDMIGPVVSGNAVASPILMVGQAPGAREGEMGKPFAWTAGKTLFKWFASIGLAEPDFRQRAYMAAVCRCFPGKNPKGGDRVPNPQEIQRCGKWLNAEIDLLQPELIIPVGKLAISQFIAVDKLVDVIGRLKQITLQGQSIDLIALPHPSGASTWHRREPGISLLQEALGQIREHSAWRAIL